MPHTLKNSIEAQRTLIIDSVGSQLKKISETIYPVIDNRRKLDAHLREDFTTLEHCKYVYVLDEKGKQISSTINRFGADEDDIGRDRSDRPYLQSVDQDFKLSDAYVSHNKKRPSMTAIQKIRDAQSQHVGYLGVDYDMRELPHSTVMYEEPSQWRQIKGDPAIRGGLFLQHRVESLMDSNIDDVLSVHETLMVHQGVHHFQCHFSSSRTTIWHVDDPYVYRILTMDELSNTDICLAYPNRPYFERAVVPAAKISKILQQFKALRFADETIYLRSASLNIVNGKIGLNFSCDGTHYLNHDEFLSKGLEFWFGGDGFPQAVVPAEKIDTNKLDKIVEQLAAEGCIQVNKTLYSVENEDVPEKLAQLSKTERDYVYQELKSVMDVYDGGVCSI
jgi:hypothetical protein